MTLLDRKSDKNQGIKPVLKTSGRQACHSLNKANNGLPLTGMTANERGSAIIWIFVMVTIFAALGYAVSEGTQTGVSSMTEQQVNLAASEIMDYAGSIKRAVKELQINGCDDTEISFENPTVASYTNANAPSDNSCHVFHPSGGGLRYLVPEENWMDSSFSSNGLYRQWTFTTSPQVDGVGTTAAELKAGIPFLKNELCMELNDRLAITNPSGAPPVDGSDPGAGLFTGTYGAPVGDNVGDDGGHNISGKTAFCRKGNTSNQFMQVLIIR